MALLNINGYVDQPASSGPRPLLRLNPNADLGDFLGNVLSDLGAGLVSQNNIGKALGAATLQGQELAPARAAALSQKQQQEEAKARDNKTRQFLSLKAPDLVAAYDTNPDLAMKAYIDRVTPKAADPFTLGPGEVRYGPDGQVIAQGPDKVAADGSSELSLTPTWGIDQDKNSPTYGKRVIGQLGKDGVFHRTEMTGIEPIDPASMAADKAATVADAKTISAAKQALPGLEQSVAITRQTIDNLRNNQAGMDEQFGNILGVPQQMLPVLPKTARANFLVDLEQATGQAFMQARQALKGAGQVTDYEGRRAEAAYSKMEAASKSGDKAKFLEAMDEFEQAVETGYQKLQAVAASNGGGGASAPPAGSTFTYNPATGELE